VTFEPIFERCYEFTYLLTSDAQEKIATKKNFTHGHPAMHR
jgi:hypothetical protein